MLGEFEYLLLSATARLGKDAYGAAIRYEIEDSTRRRCSLGALYTTLDRLEAKGLIETWMGEATPQRGGRPKRMVRVTAKGIRAAAAFYNTVTRASRGVAWQTDRLGVRRAVAAGPSTVEAAPSVKAAVDGVLELFRENSVVALSDAHGLAQEEAFYSALVRDPRFVEQVGNIVVEFGGESSQDIIDRYVAGEDVPLAELRRVWTETIGWIPGPTSLGYVNFYANVRAANLKLPPEHRIKVWLGDPKVDWSKINSFADAAPYLSRRDANFFRIIRDDILEKHKKTLLIIGGGHLFAPLGAGPLSARISGAYPHALAVVSPFTGYVEPECNARVVARAKDWPVPAVVGPVQGTWLKSELLLPGCHYAPAVVSFGPGSNKPKKDLGAAGPPGGVVRLSPSKPSSPDQKISKEKAVRVAPPGVQWLGPGKPPSPEEMASAMMSGASADAILYLGPPDSLTASPVDPNIYLDSGYFEQERRRLRCCTPFGGDLDWDQILQRNSVVPRKFKVP